ncbi:hypothetical protein VNO78_09477 [Psophocarpus tetragonolobus]|uniref:Uncharacterized protein n=1 Tax=Psophocarpus tetragonolobus TaxID=3891 RepID=A0AAN9SW34_PSOTE
MVLLGEEEDGGAKPVTTTVSPKRSNPLHNFSLPFLKWGTQRRIRCAAGRRSNSDDSLNGGEDAIEALRQRIIHDLKTQMNRIKHSILRGGEEESMPCNLQTRRASVEDPVPALAADKKQNFSSPAGHDGASKLPSLRSGSDKTERVKFALQLSKKEVEEDLFTMLGHRPPRRPNKRPKHVQRQLEKTTPGTWLTEVTPTLYKVVEAGENRKGRHNGKRKADVGF